jgi:hypothetical protein
MRPPSLRRIPSWSTDGAFVVQNHDQTWRGELQLTVTVNKNPCAVPNMPDDHTGSETCAQWRVSLYVFKMHVLFDTGGHATAFPSRRPVVVARSNGKTVQKGVDGPAEALPPGQRL